MSKHSPAAVTSTSSGATKPPITSSSAQSPTQEEADRKPWKYIGYHGFSNFLSSDDDFCNFRRFERLNIRVILALQDQLTEIEDTLDEIDQTCSRRETPDTNNGSFRQDTQQARTKLIWEAYRKLERYNRYIYQYVQIKSRASPAKRDIDSLRNWFYNHDGAIMPEERKYIDKNDLFTLVPKDRSPLRRLFERSSRFRLFQLWQRKPPTPDLPLYLQNVHYSSDKRIDRFIMLTIMMTGLVMLLTPIWVLAYTDPLAVKLAIITAFILFFLALVSLGTNAKPYESLAATAAYTTILMVFLQIGGPRNGQA
ncbi:hypothetical protein N7535_006361 [Penicillium sp. DV-2018c]|nr:hypothetical protein N7461_007559 [Penicillium sp. DV-2018c]KAJ5567055.1 hypothetical protein N7535_006361 [Penicillium sp. DV-2018c]